ncbi:MAG TPA: heme-binding protein, partial [Planctomycetaceae bacterium]|nr:heme-binding protein [Planctomycetaceae bacterium]
KQILHPSVEINKKYQSSIVVTDEGKVYTGLITAQSDAAITLMPNPLKPEFTVTLKRDEIDEVALSDKSTMPEGLLMTFTKEEILDLLAFIQGAAEPGGE